MPPCNSAVQPAPPEIRASYVGKKKKQVVTEMATRACIAAAAQIDPSYALGGVNVHPSLIHMVPWAHRDRPDATP